MSYKSFLHLKNSHIQKRVGLANKGIHMPVEDMKNIALFLRANHLLPWDDSPQPPGPDPDPPQKVDLVKSSIHNPYIFNQINIAAGSTLSNELIYSYPKTFQYYFSASPSSEIGQLLQTIKISDFIIPENDETVDIPPKCALIIYSSIDPFPINIIFIANPSPTSVSITVDSRSVYYLTQPYEVISEGYYTLNILTDISSAVGQFAAMQLRAAAHAMYPIYASAHFTPTHFVE